MTDQTTVVPGAQGQDGNVDTDRITIGNPAGTCARSCEGNAYQIEIRRLKNRISELEALLAGTREGTANIGVERAYSYSENGEVFTGEFESPEAAAADFFRDHPERTMVDVGLSIRNHAEFYVHGEEIIEGIAMQLARAAACYANPFYHPDGRTTSPMGWPWSPGWWKPTTYRRNLVKAGALILAEIERLDRIKSPKDKG